MLMFSGLYKNTMAAEFSEYGMKVSEKKIESDLYTWSEERENVEFVRK